MSAGLALLFLYVGIALGVSFLCSLLEAGLLATRDSDLAARAEAGNRGVALLYELKSKRIDDAISAILTLNTVAHTIGATLAGAHFPSCAHSGQKRCVTIFLWVKKFTTSLACALRSAWRLRIIPPNGRQATGAGMPTLTPIMPANVCVLNCRAQYPL